MIHLYQLISGNAWRQTMGHSPEFLSTHPADKTRIEQIRAYLPEAMRYYRR